ncbi:MAG: CNNM domain-containing protein [Candidatus Peribacteraceae bacterium]|nr:CNNM domain-containing protein [Candidatus Peribacteraceae bacterium]
MLTLILLIVAFVLASGLLSMLDAAFLSVSRAEVEETLVHGLWGGRALKGIAERQMRTVIVIVILTNFVNVLGPVLIGVRAAALFGSQAIGIVTALLTALTIFFSEIIPKALGTRYGPTISRIGAPALFALVVLFTPVVAFIEMLVKPFRQGDRPTGTEAQIQALARIGGEQGHIEADELSMIRRSFVLNDKKARDIMVKTGVFASLPYSATIREAAAAAAQWPHHRYPVLNGDGRAAGFVMSRELLQALVAGRGDESVTTILHEPVLIPPGMRADHILELLRDKRLHLAIVSGEKGDVLGIVTLKDVLEELVGEMRDERRI